jgi:hypothetical protein
VEHIDENVGEGGAAGERREEISGDLRWSEGYTETVLRPATSGPAAVQSIVCPGRVGQLVSVSPPTIVCDENHHVERALPEDCEREHVRAIGCHRT